MKNSIEMFMVTWTIMKPREIASTALALAGIAFMTCSAFTYEARQRIGKRDNWKCRVSGSSWGQGWNLHMAHDINKHQNTPDDDISHGGLLRVDLHIIEHLKVGDLGEARLAYSQHSIRNYNWIACKAGVTTQELTQELIDLYDEKPPFEYYQEVARTMTLEEYVTQSTMVEA